MHVIQQGEVEEKHFTDYRAAKAVFLSKKAQQAHISIQIPDHDKVGLDCWVSHSWRFAPKANPKAEFHMQVVRKQSFITMRNKGPEKEG